MCNALAMTPFLKLLLLYSIICKRDQMWFTAYVRLTAQGSRPTAYGLQPTVYGSLPTVYGLIQTIAFGLLLYLTSNELHLMTLTL